MVGAAGGGREVIALHNRGIKAEAFDSNTAFVDYCRKFLAKLGIDSNIVLAEPNRVPDEFGTYDDLIMGFGGYMHIAGQDTRILFLKQCRKHIKPNGPILLSFCATGGFIKSDHSKIRIARFIKRIKGKKESMEIGDSLGKDGYFHNFTKEEICEELEEAGFKIISSFADANCWTDSSFPYVVLKVKDSNDNQ